MQSRTGKAQWKGSITGGGGQVTLEKGNYEGSYTFGSRFENDVGTNPEELMGAAHAGCFAMALSGALGEAGYEPDTLDASTKVTVEDLGDGEFEITTLETEIEGSVPDIDEDEFQEIAQAAFENCPVSKAFSAIENRTLTATLVS